uniref:Uncharacterized protein n=1 Tax=Arundo donax TaxID=35708 RepID=A0A0A9F2X5_ARUDO
MDPYKMLLRIQTIKLGPWILTKCYCAYKLSNLDHRISIDQTWTMNPYKAIKRQRRNYAYIQRYHAGSLLERKYKIPKLQIKQIHCPVMLKSQ